MSKDTDKIKCLLEDIIECFISGEGSGYTIENDVGELVRVSSDVEELIDKAIYVLYEEGDENGFVEYTE